MCENAEHTGSGVYSGADDMRVTRVGKIIRATSIDELPQLVNILKGDIRIIYENKKIKKYDKYNLNMPIKMGNRRMNPLDVE